MSESEKQQASEALGQDTFLCPNTTGWVHETNSKDFFRIRVIPTALGQSMLDSSKIS